MGRKTYTYRTSSFTVGGIIFILLILLCLSFVAGYYLGKQTPSPQPQPTGRQAHPTHIQTSRISPPVAKQPAHIPPEEDKKTSPQKSTSSSVKTPPKTEVKKEKPSGTYYLQVAALKNSSSALRLSLSLKKEGFNTTIKTEGAFSVVLVGPFASAKEAKVVRMKLFKILGKYRVRVRRPKDILLRRAR